MKQRLRRSARLHVTHKVVVGQGRAHGRNGWVTQSMVAHAMNMRPGCYVLGLLNELHRTGKLLKTKIQLPNGVWCYEFRDINHENFSDGIPF